MCYSDLLYQTFTMIIAREINGVKYINSSLSMKTSEDSYRYYYIFIIIPSLIVELILGPTFLYNYAKSEKSFQNYRMLRFNLNILNADLK